MPYGPLYNQILQARRSGRKRFAVLIDPDGLRPGELSAMTNHLRRAPVDLLLIGGSLIVEDQLNATLRHLKKHLDLPIIIFPGSPLQINGEADAILLLSLISGRNPDLLIGQHVTAAPYLRASGLEILPTGYLLIDGGKPTTASYISQSPPIPADKPTLAACTALAGEQLGLGLIYLDAGSGARIPVSEAMIREVRRNVELPLLVGGGIRSGEAAYQACKAGADLIVVGNAVEKDPGLVQEIGLAVRNFKTSPTP